MSRSKIGFTLKKVENDFEYYEFSHRKITRNSPRGVWQFDLVRKYGKQVPRILFTCPMTFCGEINCYPSSLPTIEYGMTYNAHHLVTVCHRCRFCLRSIPFGVGMSFQELKKKYLKVAKKAVGLVEAI